MGCCNLCVSGEVLSLFLYDAAHWVDCFLWVVAIVHASWVLFWVLIRWDCCTTSCESCGFPLCGLWLYLFVVLLMVSVCYVLYLFVLRLCFDVVFYGCYDDL